MILFNYQGKEIYLYPIVSARFQFDSKFVLVSQSYNEVDYLRFRIAYPYTLISVTRDDYVTLRNIYYELSSVFYTPTVAFLKNAGENSAYFRLTSPAVKGGLSYPLDAILLVERNFDFNKSYTNGIVIKKFLKYVADGLDFLEHYYGRLPF
jgi:hypothetical protein